MVSQQNVHSFSVTTIDGVTQSLSEYKGKVVLLVNVASFCGYTKQYSQLQNMYEELRERGFVVLGFPSNEFGEQEPGSDQEIKIFCSSKYNVTFPLFSKLVVNGNDAHPLYSYLTSGGGKQELAGPIRWNFEKFLIDTNGKIVKRYGSRAEPLTDILPDIEQLLSNSQ
ncbi:MAG: glutathione peroxidase [Ignavibacteria bacterium]|nr:glutathione peroxidase [Ignavibacteria bacterium]